MTEDFEGFLTILLYNLLSKISVKMGHNIPYMCTNFEENQLMKKLSLQMVGLKLVFWNGAIKKKKMWSKLDNIQEKYLAN